MRFDSHHALPLLLKSIDGFNDMSELRIRLGLRTLDPVEALSQPGELIIEVASRAFEFSRWRRRRRLYSRRFRPDPGFC